MIEDPQFLTEFDSLFVGLNSNELGCSHRFGEHQRGHAYGAEAHNKDCVVARYAHFFNRFVDGTKATCYLSTIGVGQFIGKKNQILFITEDVWGHAPITLPPIGGSKLAGAANHIALATIITNSTAGDVVDDDSVTLFEAPHPFAHFNDLTAGFVTGDHVLIPFGAFAEVLAVDRPNVAATNR